MPRFLIRREVPGVTREDVDAAAFRALSCAFEFPGLRWIDSQWDREDGALYCLYEAESAEQCREHARRARIPADDVREVVTIAPDEYGSMGTLSSLEQATG